MRRFRLPAHLKIQLTLATRLKTAELRGLCLSDLGFHRLRLKRSLEVWRNLKLGLVLKKGHFLYEQCDEVCCPTRWLEDGWVVQPLVTREGSGEALKTLKARLPEGVRLDLHRGNVGWIGDEPVAFDW